MGMVVSTQICLVFMPVASDVLEALFTMFDLHLYWPKFQRNPISLNAEGNQTLCTCLITVKCHTYNTVLWWKWSVCKVAMMFKARRTKFTASHCVLTMLAEPPCSQLPQTVAPGLLLVTCVGNSHVCHSGYGFLLLCMRSHVWISAMATTFRCQNARTLLYHVMWSKINLDPATMVSLVTPLFLQYVKPH